MSSLPDVAAQLPGSGDQPSPQPVPDGQQQVAQAVTYDPNVHTLIETAKLANVDPNNFVSHARKYQDSQRSGLAELGDWLSEQGYSPWQVKQELAVLAAENAAGDGQTNGQANAQANIQANAQAAQAQVQPVEQQDTQARQPDTKAEILAEARQERAAERDQDKMDRGYVAETGFMGTAMTELGFPDGSEGRDWRIKSQLEGFCKHQREQDVHQNNPDRQRLIAAPYTEVEVDAAVAALKPLLANQASAAQEHESDNQAAQNLPNGSLDGGGTGGRAQVPTDKMSREQKREIVEKRYEAEHGVKPM